MPLKSCPARCFRKLKQTVQKTISKRKERRYPPPILISNYTPIQAPLSVQAPTTDLKLASCDQPTTPTATPAAHAWLGFHPHVDLIQLPLGHPGLNELPYIRDHHFMHPRMPKARRWSFPAYVHPSATQTQLVASLGRIVDQDAEIQVLNARMAEQTALIDDWDEHIERLLAGSEGKLEEDRGYICCELIMPEHKAVEEGRVWSLLRGIRERCSPGRKLKAKRAALVEAEREVEETLEAVARGTGMFGR